MKHNLNLFSNTKKNLDQFNSRMLIIFLLLFNIVISIVLFINMYNEQKVELFDIAKQEISELKINIDGYPSNIPVANMNQTKGIFLTYFIKSNNELVISDEFSKKSRDSVIKEVKNWHPVRMEAKYKKIHVSNSKPLYLLIVSQNSYEHGQLKGTIYIGKDITFLRNMFIRFLLILLGISLIFFIMALLVGQMMTKRAMKPIVKSYTLQSEFIADASHELRTPLSVLKSGIDAIEFEEGDKFSSFSKNTLFDLKEEIRSATKLVNHLLFLIRSDSGELSSLLENFDVLELMQQVIRSFHPLSESKEMKLDLQTMKPISVYTDKEKVKQLLYILMDNAIKYTPVGGCVSIFYDLKYVNQSHRLCIMVRDNGIGISKEQQERIFDRFYRVDKSRSRQGGSSGLGLAIGQSIVESLNGTIEVSSTLKKGSEFTVSIPIQTIE